MNKNIVRILLMFFCFVILIYTFNNNFIYAEDSVPSWDVSGDFDPSEGWAKSRSGEVTDQTDADKEIADIGNSIIGPIQVIGSLVSVIAIIIIGIRYMLGSVEERAQYKETLGPYLIGAVFVFAIVNILTIVYDIAKSV